MNRDGGAQDGAASPIRNVEDVENSILKETLQDIQTVFPDFLDALTDNDREALFNIQTEFSEEMQNIIPSFRRIIAARNCYVEGFLAGMRQMMAGISDHLMAYSDEIDQNMVIDMGAVSPTTSSINEQVKSGNLDDICIFWFTPPLIEFDCETRPLSWCNGVQSWELSDEKENRHDRMFHGHPLVTKVAVSYDIPLTEQFDACDPRLPHRYFHA